MDFSETSCYAERINELLAQWRRKVGGGGSKAVLQVLDLIGANPYLTVRGAEKSLDVAYNTAVRAIARLEAAGILAKVSDAKRDRLYCAKALLDILEEPARLTPIETTR